jgi:hypothetical protein
MATQAAPTTAYAERARYASLRRSRQPDDPDLLRAHHRMREETTVNLIKRALKDGPLITAELRQRIVALVAVDEADVT